MNGKKAGDGINKMEAVRQVISKHGKDVMPVDIVTLVKAEHGVDMNADMASTYKSTALKQLGLSSGRKGKRGGKRGPKPAAAPTAEAAKAAPKASRGGEVSIEDLRAVKHLVGRLGADKLRQLAEVLA